MSRHCIRRGSKAFWKEKMSRRAVVRPIAEDSLQYRVVGMHALPSNMRSLAEICCTQSKTRG